MIENQDYQLIPLEDDSDTWGVRITSGQFIETVIVFGAVGIDEETDNFTFNFDIYSSPDSDLTPDDVDLQEVCGDILQSIILNEDSK